MTANGQDTIRQMVTDRILAELAKGVVPWHKPWNAYPMSMSTNKPYRGINVWLLGSPEFTSQWWGTYNKATKLGGKLLDGQGKKYQIAIFWSRIEKEDKATGETTRFFMLRYYRVYNAEQFEGLPEKYYQKPTSDNAEIATADELLKEYLSGDGPTLKHGGNGANYAMATDTIRMPAKSTFDDSDSYYLALFHEATHSTGHTDRLNRPGVADFDHFGSDQYAREELIAQMGATMLAAFSGVDPAFGNSASYIAGWMKAIKSENDLVIRASSAAQKASDFILGIKFTDAEPENGNGH